MLEFFAMKTIVIASVKQACNIAGGQRALARVLGVSSALVYQWTAGIRGVPIRYCQAIVELTEGQVTVQSLRPKDWHLVWPAPKNTSTDQLHTIHYDPNEGSLI